MKAHTPLIVFAFVCCSLGRADLIPISSVTGHHQGDNLTGSGSILTTINEVGITKPDANDPATWTHGAAWQEDWQEFNALSLTANQGWMVFDAGSRRSDWGGLPYKPRDALVRDIQDKAFTH